MDNKLQHLTKLAACPACGGHGTVRVVDGAAVRRRRENHGKSLRSVAAHMGHSSTYLSDVERGLRQPDPEPFLRRFLAALPKADADARTRR